LGGAITNLNTEVRINLSQASPCVVLFVSGSIDALLGFNADDFLTGKVTLQSRIHAHDQDIANVLFSNEIHPASGTFNIRLRHADGRIRCIKGQYTKKVDNTHKGILLELLLQDAKSLWKQQGNQTLMDNFKAMMDNTDDYIYFKDRNHVFTGASETLVAITDPSEHWSDLLGKTDYDVFPEEYADVYYSLEKQVFAGIKIAHEEQETLDNDGNKGWVDNRKYPIKNENGEIVGLFGIARDITESKLTKDLLARSEAKYYTLFDSKGDAVLMLDEKGFFDCNQAALEMFGLPSKEALSQYHPAQLSPPTQVCGTDSMVLANHYIKTAMQKGTARFEWLHRRADTGKTFAADVLLTSLTLDGNLILQTTIRDISERKQIEQQLSDNEKRLRLALISANQAWFELNVVTGEVLTSPEYPRMLGYDPETFHTNLQEWLQNIHPEDIGEVSEAMKECLRDGGPKHLDYRRRTSAGDWLWLNSIGSVTEWDQTHQPLRMIGVHTNITERKRLELELTKQAHLDYLTGLSNRRHFMLQGEIELSRAIRYNTPLSLLMLDIDFFKNVNDTYGHQVGDTVLQVLGKICLDTLRQVDIAGRLGGEEFAVILPETTIEEAIEVAERLREVVAKVEMTVPLYLTVSIGVTTLKNKDTSIDMLLNQADKALYEAKEAGRNKVCVG
jgi:hypothetical protein